MSKPNEEPEESKQWSTAHRGWVSRASDKNATSVSTREKLSLDETSASRILSWQSGELSEAKDVSFSLALQQHGTYDPWSAPQFDMGSGANRNQLHSFRSSARGVKLGMPKTTVCAMLKTLWTYLGVETLRVQSSPPVYVRETWALSHSEND